MTRDTKNVEEWDGRSFENRNNLSQEEIEEIQKSRRVKKKIERIWPYGIKTCI